MACSGRLFCIIMIFTGSWLISQFDWILYIFGAFLLFTGVKMALAHEDESGIGDKPLVRWLRGHLRMTSTIDNSISLCARMACCTPHR